MTSLKISQNEDKNFVPVEVSSSNLGNEPANLTLKNITDLPF
ncbi:MAG: hypothetical protein WC727_11890 [Ignavibacteriaceae bacterium]